jgi:cell division protein FtsQ
VAGRVLLALALLAAGTFAGREGWRLATTSAALRIREIRFQGLRAAEARELLELSPVKAGDNLLTADVDGLERALLRHRWLAGVRVERRWPPALQVTAVEHQAVAQVDLGRLYLVTRAGQVFKSAEVGDDLDLPVITGFTADDYQQRNADVKPLLRGALELIDLWAAAGLAGALPLAEVHLDGAEGVTVFAGEEGVEVRLGIGEPAPKLEKLKAVLSALRAEGKRAEVVLLDNRAHPSWVTVRPSGSGGARAAGRTGPRGL